ncbi:MAG: hypothetical protein FJ387_31515, partial [Verrucomicrobia bacterium]|nr:hypothetical protein [Verrucomicrobiota bacterium]
MACSAFFLVPLQARDYWLAVVGTGGTPENNSESLAIPYDRTTVQTIIRDKPGAPPDDNTVTLIFKPGLYLTDRLQILETTPGDRILVIKSSNPATPATFKLKMPTANDGAWPEFFLGPTWSAWLLDFELYNKTNALDGLTRFEAHDLVLDVNWPEWAAGQTAANPAYVDALRLSGLRVRGQEGLIRNVRIKNCGASGLIPWPYWIEQGAEGFPLMVNGTAFRPQQPGSLWVVQNYSVCSNVVRLSHVPQLQNYRGYEWQDHTIGTYTFRVPVSFSHQSKAIGRLEAGYSVGLRLGGTDQVWLEHNRFTTRHINQFYEPNPALTNLAKWTPLYKPDVDPRTELPTYHGTVYSGNNSTSVVAFTLYDPQPILQPETPVDALAGLHPYLGFVPEGRPGRTVLGWDYPGRLVFAEEIVLSAIQTVGGNWEVQAAHVLQPAHRVGSWTMFFGWPPDYLRAVVRVNGVSLMHNLAPVQTTTYTALFRYPVQGAGGHVEFIVYQNYGGPFDPDQGAWSASEKLEGTTVRVERGPDVADDRRQWPGSLTIARSGPTASPLEVLLKPPTTPMVRPAQPEDFDLYTEGGVPIPRDAYGRWTATIPAGTNRVTVR